MYNADKFSLLQGINPLLHTLLKARFSSMHNQRKILFKESNSFMHINSLAIKDKFISMIPNAPTSSEENFLETY